MQAEQRVGEGTSWLERGGVGSLQGLWTSLWALATPLGGWAWGQVAQGEGCVSQGNAPGQCGPEVWVQSRVWVLQLAPGSSRARAGRKAGCSHHILTIMKLSFEVKTKTKLGFRFSSFLRLLCSCGHITEPEPLFHHLWNKNGPTHGFTLRLQDC